VGKLKLDNCDVG